MTKQIGQLYQQHEEDDEHVGHEENGAEDPVGRLQLVEVKVSQDDSEQRVPRRWSIHDCLGAQWGMTTKASNKSHKMKYSEKIFVLRTLIKINQLIVFP